MKLALESLKNEKEWLEAGISPPRFDIEKMRRETRKNPRWVHFGAGNIFRGYIAALQQGLLERGRADTGIIAAEPYDGEIIGRIYRPCDNLALRVLMNADGTYDKAVVAAVAEGLDAGDGNDWDRLRGIFEKPSLQLVSFTITEKGYNADRAVISEDIKRPRPKHAAVQTAALLYARYKSGRHPVALVSLDNCACNGEKLRDAVLAAARILVDNGRAEEGFIAYVSDERLVSFPWSMIDKITPQPSERVGDMLRGLGLESADIVETAKHTFIAPFVNAEKPQYLVVEDNFPNGRPPLEDAGVYMTDRETVEKAERMKVAACLNPLHTALAVFGCLLGYTLIADEMNDPELSGLVRRIGYDEGMPVVSDPGIIRPEAFIAEVLTQRLPNPNIPDTPQRIATDTSQKVIVRYGGTIGAYVRKYGDAGRLVYIPLAIAGWCRYLMGVNDRGGQMPLSPDPLLDRLTDCVSGMPLGSPKPEKIRRILSDRTIFGMDLYEAGLGEKIEAYFAELCAGPGAVRQTLRKYIG